MPSVITQARSLSTAQLLLYVSSTDKEPSPKRLVRIFIALAVYFYSEIFKI